MPKIRGICSVDGCGMPHYGNGFCGKHNRRFKLYGDPLGTAPKKEHPECSIPGCHRPNNSHGLCSMHDHRMRRYGDPLGVPPNGKRNGLAKRFPQEHKSYKGMKTRCLNPNCPEFAAYGGRGIKICKRWLGPNGFEHFLEDMGPKPTYDRTAGGMPLLSLDRVDVNGDYCKSNCRWATWTEQNLNRRGYGGNER